MAKQVTISLATAELIRRVFLPRNPHQMRAQAPETKKALREFNAAIDAAYGNSSK